MNIRQLAAEADAGQAGHRQRSSWLETMMLIRAYEEKLVELQQHGAPGTCTSVGQEACAVGVVSALDGRDRILTNHRSAGHLIARGADVGRLFAEVLGREDGYCKGRSGSLHISAEELGVVLTSTIVGGELSMAPGVALAQKTGKGELVGEPPSQSLQPFRTSVEFDPRSECEGPCGRPTLSWPGSIRFGGISGSTRHSAFPL
jgi:TPP-dependent pyruvate/acetoin dehydrogenase alpha subunit